MSLEVLIPFDRADQGLAVQLRRLARAAAWLPGLSRVLLVADAPGVQVPSQVASAARGLPCRWLKLSQAQGPAAAVAAGIQSAESQTLVTMAPGPVFPVEQIPWLVKRLVRADVVWGRRSSTRVGKWWHRWRSLPLRIAPLVGAVCERLRPTVSQADPALETEVVEFIGERFRNLLLAEGQRADVVEAVFSCGFGNVVDTRRKVEALGRLAASEEEFKSLAIAFKRVVNIVGNRRPGADVDEGLFEEEAERSLWESFLSIKGEVEDRSRKGDYVASLDLMKRLKEPVDRFFDEVLVMDEREEKRNNRLAMLWRIRDLFFSVADFSKIST